MGDQEEIKEWIESSFPLLWSLLNPKAQRSLPKGLMEYIGPDSPSGNEAVKYLASIESCLADLKDLCGWKSVGDNYRKPLSGATSENQVVELFCEIAVCASVGKFSGKLQLHPQTEKGTHSDCLFEVRGFAIYGEVKRYPDPWPYIENPGKVPNENIPYGRSITESPPGEKPHDSARPRSMDLRSKLRNVHRQFPDGSLNILFIFHHSLGETEKYLRQALFGNANFFATGDDLKLGPDGLFSVEEWRNISACYLARATESGVIFPFGWKNPRALSGIPKCVLEALK